MPCVGFVTFSSWTLQGIPTSQVPWSKKKKSSTLAIAPLPSDSPQAGGALLTHKEAGLASCTTADSIEQSVPRQGLERLICYDSWTWLPGTSFDS